MVYNVNQQRVRYLVEFATADDIPRTIDIARQDDSYLSSDTARDKGKKGNFLFVFLFFLLITSQRIKVFMDHLQFIAQPVENISIVYRSE